MYDIKKFRSKRPRTRYIIIAHAVDFIQSKYEINPIVNRGNYHYTWDLWQDYWLLKQKRLDVPCHFFVELLNKDYAVFTGLAQQKKSYFLYELSQNGIIDSKYADSLLVIIGENFHYDLPETRLYEHIANRILSPMCYQYKLDYNSEVLLLDEILNPGYDEKLEKLDYTNYTFMDKFNKDLFLMYSKPFMKLIQMDSILG